MPSINEEYEREHLRNLRNYQRQIEAEYNAFIDRIFRYAVGLRAAESFRITDYPSLNAMVSIEMERFKMNIEARIVNGLQEEWNLSNRKNDAIHFQKYGKLPHPKVQDKLTQASQQAYAKFVNRKLGRLTLSDRVFNLTHQLQSEIEKTLFTGLQEGKAATRMATDMKQYLKEPDKLFRRVRDANGKLQLSSEAKKYHPGQGVYRSSYKNARRMTVTETNRAYRSADVARWNASKFILGYEVKLSNNHPRFDQCDILAGPYPTTFKFNSWHPHCRCYAVPILPSAEEYAKYETAILRGTDDSFRFQNVIREPHAGVKQYLEDNKEMLARTKTPLWIKENPRFTKAE